MDFNRATTWSIFVTILAVATIAMVFTPMTTDTIFMMVVPSMVVFGLVMVWLGIQHGEWRARP